MPHPRDDTPTPNPTQSRPHAPASTTRELRGKVEFIQQRHEKFGRMLKAPGATAADPAFKELYTCEWARVDGFGRWIVCKRGVLSLTGRRFFYHIIPYPHHAPKKRCTGTWRRPRSSARSWRRWWRSSRTTASASATSTTCVRACVFACEIGGYGAICIEYKCVNHGQCLTNPLPPTHPPTQTKSTRRRSWRSVARS